MRLLAVGDNCVDHYKELGRRFPGGNALNVAVYSARVPGVDADYLGVIGTDPNGDFMKRQIRAEGLDASMLQRAEGETAVTTILVRGGDRVFDHYLEGVQENAKLRLDAIPSPERYDIMHFTVWGYGREHVQWLKENTDVKLSCDFSGQLDDPRTGIMPYLDYSFFSGSSLVEKVLNPEEKIRELKRRTSGLVLMTLGEHGSIAYDGETMYRGDVLPVDVVDTLGAGDSYIAAFLCSRLRGEVIQRSMDNGHLAAREICRRLGAWGGE